MLKMEMGRFPMRDDGYRPAEGGKEIDHPDSGTGEAEQNGPTIRTVRTFPSSILHGDRDRAKPTFLEAAVKSNFNRITL